MTIAALSTVFSDSRYASFPANSVLPEAEKYRSSCQNPKITTGPNYGVSHNKHHVKSNGLVVLRIVSFNAM
ncbi:hypothetical protein DPMN_093312 [Dreissena polymorpha]|uniref:Uncharacterized protein n=1 Tax=Dreissena polymorpha TaxID=45954 RepID=A0A9D4L2P6_DREPO|nr:hypothetical protein DPMN_093312 [Dreissena polymorpha]